MPSNRRSRRAFDKKVRSGAFKACGAAASLAAMIAGQIGLAPAASADVRTFSVKYAGEDFGTGPRGDQNDANPGLDFLSLRDAVKYARTGDSIDLGTIEVEGDVINVFVDGKITINKSVNFINSSSKKVVIHSYARHASNWYTDLDDDGTYEFYFNNNGLSDYDYAPADNRDINWYTDNEDTVVGNTIFNIAPSNPGHSEESDETHVTFSDVTITGSAFYANSQDDYEGTFYTNHNYAPLVTIESGHSGSVSFENSIITDTEVTSFYSDFYDGQFLTTLAAASGVANYSEFSTELIFENSELTDSFINTNADWDEQFANLVRWDGPDSDGWGDRDQSAFASWYYEGDNGEGNSIFQTDRGTASVVFSATGDVSFNDSLAEQNYADTVTHDTGWVADWGSAAKGTVFGLLSDANLTITGESSIWTNENHADGGSNYYGPYGSSSQGGVGYLEDGNLYIHTDDENVIDGEHVEIYSNYLENGDGGAFSLINGRFDLRGDIRFLENINSGDDGGVIYLDGNETDAASFVGGGVEFTGNYADGNGGAIWNHGDLVIGSNTASEVLFSNNSSDGSNGGAIHTGFGYLTISNTTFSENDAISDAEGGAVFVHEVGDSLVTFTNSTFISNTSDYDGGAVYVDANNYFDGIGSLYVGNSSFTGNVAGLDGDGYNGGALVVDGAMDVEIAYSTFSNNLTDEDGGAIYLDLDENDALIRDSQFTNNRAGDDSGAVYAQYGTYLDVENSIFNYNVAADGDGGAINFEEDATVTGSIFRGNIADDEGGAIWTDESLHVYDSTFDSNGKEIRASGTSNNPLVVGATYVGEEFYLTYDFTNDGGAIAVLSGDLVVRGVEFDGNTAERNGGAIFHNQGYGDTIWAIDSTFFANSAREDGGAVYFGSEGNAYFVNTTFSGNAANDDGSSVYASDNGLYSNVYLVNSTIVNDGYDMGQSGEFNYIGDADSTVYGDDVFVINSIVSDTEGFDAYTVDMSNNLTDDFIFDDGVAYSNSQWYLDSEGFKFVTNEPVDNGGAVSTIAITKQSIAFKYIRSFTQNNDTDLDWLLDENSVDLDGTNYTIAELIETDARGIYRGNFMDVGSYEASRSDVASSSGSSGGGGGGSVEPTPTPTPSPEVPEVLEPVVVNVTGFAPGSPALTKSIKAKISKAVQANSKYSAIVLKGFTVTKADLTLAKNRALNVKNYILKLMPGIATKVVKGKVADTRKVKLTFKETL